MSEAIRTASYGHHRNSFFRAGVVEPDMAIPIPLDRRYCDSCDKPLSRYNSSLCFQCQERDRGQRFADYTQPTASENVPAGSRLDKRPRLSL